MNGRTHALSGMAVIPPTALSSGLPLPETVVLTAISAGFALGPDIDHPASTVTRAVGKPFHLLAHGLSQAAVTVLSKGRDRRSFAWAEANGRDPLHRTLTHTLAFGAGIAGMVYGAAQWSWSAGILAALSLWACRRLFPKQSRSLLLGAMAAFLAMCPFLDIDPQLVAAAAGAGWLSHLLADACTSQGVPLLWPIPVRGKMWYRFRFLGDRIKVCDEDQNKQYAASFAVAVVMMLPYYILG